MSMPRRPFDASFSRRPGHGSGPGGGLAPSVAGPVSSLMGEYGGYGEEGDEVKHYSKPPPPPARVSRNSGGPYRGEEFDYEQPAQSQQFDRVPREGARVGGGGGRPRPREDYDEYRTGNGGGGWRQRSPSPSRRFHQSRDRDEDDRGRDGSYPRNTPSWTTRGSGGGGDFLDETDFIGGGGRSSSGSSSNFRQAQAQSQDFLALQQQQRMFANPTGILRNADPIVKVLLQPGGGLMGNMGLNNPFGMLGASPMMAFANASPFGQPQLLQQQSSNSFGNSSVGSSIYGSQTQQAFDRSRNLITASDSNSRRNDFYRGRGRGGGGGGGGAGGRRSESDNRSRSDSASRNDSPRKRNLVLRDPHPEDIKRPRVSGGAGRNSQNNRKSTGQVKRVDISGDGGRKSLGSSHRPASATSDKKDSKKDKDKSATEPPAEGDEVKKTGDDKEKSEATTEKDKEKDKDRKTEYDGIPGSLLVCKVCQKSMNDGQSFESHLSGRAHQSLLKIMEERMSKRVELLMNESKCAEDEIGIEMDRQRRAGVGRGRAEKKPNNYCKMCDCHYAMNWGAHKVSLGHRILKAFLHPTCQFCKTHFMHRRDWVLHLVTPDHLKKLAALKEEQGTNPLLEEQESPSQDELFTIYFDRNGEERTTNVITIKSKDGRESLTEEMKEILKNDRGEIVLPDGAIPLPKEYNSELTVGADAVVAVDGNRCRVCRVYIPADKSVDVHCSSREHFNEYVSFLKRVNAFREHKERDRKEAEEKAKREEERRKRREEEAAAKKAKAEAAAKDKESAGETTTNGESKMELDADGEVKIVAEGDSSEQKKVVEVVDLDDDAEDEEEEEHGGNEDDILEDEDNEEEEEEEEEEIEGEDAFIPTEADDHEAKGGDGSEDVEMTEDNSEAGVPDEQEETEESESNPVILQVTSVAPDTVLLDQDLNTNGSQDQVEEEEHGQGEESNDSVQELQDVEIIPPVAAPKTPATARRGRGGRGKPAGTPALRNVQAKVDTNMRGGRGRGGPRGSRSRGRGAR